MRFLKIALGVLVVVAAIAAVAAPLGPMPGFWIGGTSTAAPAQWGTEADVHEIMLKVPGPRVVIIWVVNHENDLHVVGAKDSGWVQNIGAGAPVALRIEDKTYALNAAPVDEGWQDVVQAWVAKYEADYPEIIEGLPSLDEAGDSVAVFRLTRT